MRATCPAHLVLLIFITRIIFGEQQRSLSSLLYSFFPLPCHLVPLRPKYSPQHSIFRHPQTTIHPQSHTTLVLSIHSWLHISSLTASHHQFIKDLILARD
jgi:hypothetical protein